MTAKISEVVKPEKKGFYGFIWRVLLEDDLYQLQRFSKEYRCWFTVSSDKTEERIFKMLEEISPSEERDIK